MRAGDYTEILEDFYGINSPIKKVGELIKGTCIVRDRDNNLYYTFYERQKRDEITNEQKYMNYAFYKYNPIRKRLCEVFFHRTPELSQDYLNGIDEKKTEHGHKQDTINSIECNTYSIPKAHFERLEYWTEYLTRERVEVLIDFQGTNYPIENKDIPSSGVAIVEYRDKLYFASYCKSHGDFQSIWGYKCEPSLSHTYLSLFEFNCSDNSYYVDKYSNYYNEKTLHFMDTREYEDIFDDIRGATRIPYSYSYQTPMSCDNEKHYNALVRFSNIKKFKNNVDNR